MSQQDYEVIVSSTEHKHFLSLQTQLNKLQTQLAQSQQSETQKNDIMHKYQQQVHIKNQEINFLQTLIEQLGSRKQKQPDIDVSHIKSNLFEVLGQSLMYNKQNAELDRLDQKKQIYTKFQRSLQKAQEITDRLQSQEELITKLNQVNTQNNILLTSRNPDELLKELEKDCQTRFENIEELKQLIKEDGKIKQQNFNLQTKNKLNEEEIKKLKEDLRKVTPLIAHNNEKIKLLETEKTQLQKKNTLLQNEKAQLNKQSALLEAEKAQLHKQNKSLETEKVQLKKQNLQLEIERTQLQKQHGKIEKQEPQSKGDKSYRIKLLIDQHIKQIEASLKNVGGLSQLQIAGLVESQLKDIIAYVPKSIAGRKK